MRLPVTKQAKRECITQFQAQYLAGAKAEQSSVLDVLEKLTKFNRKYLIRVLNRRLPPKYPKAVYGSLVKKKLGAPRIYHAPEIIAFLT